MRFKVLSTLLALLGFGASCSGVRHAGKSAEQAPGEVPDREIDTQYVEPPIRLMYGVPPRDYRVQPSAEETPEDRGEPAGTTNDSSVEGAAGSTGNK